MTLEPGTRIPNPMTTMFHRSYYRGLVEGLVLGGAVGTILGVMCAALAWSHLGG